MGLCDVQWRKGASLGFRIGGGSIKISPQNSSHKSFSISPEGAA